MKKNWTMRVALLMLALTLITSCFVSGTYAKYITTADGSDTARVAEFGVTILAEGNLFADTYKAASNNTPGVSGDDIADVTKITVVANGAAAGDDNDNVVAPGTKNTQGLTFTVAGTPEVAVAVTITASSTKDIYLGKANGLPNMTTAATDDTFDLANDYYPVVYTLKQNGTTIETGTMADIVSALSNLTHNYPANTNLATAIGTLNLTWEWAYGTAGATVSGNDKEDTLLGDIAAGITLTPALPSGATSSTEVDVTITIAITQID